MFTRRAAFEKILQNFETEGRTFADVPFPTQIQAKERKSHHVHKCPFFL